MVRTDPIRQRLLQPPDPNKWLGKDERDGMRDEMLANKYDQDQVYQLVLWMCEHADVADTWIRQLQEKT